MEYNHKQGQQSRLHAESPLRKAVGEKQPEMIRNQNLDQKRPGIKMQKES